MILEEYGLLDESECCAIWKCTSMADAERLLSGYVKRAFTDYRKSAKFLHLSRRATRNTRSGFEPVDRVVVEVFSDLHKARHLKSNKFAGTSPAAVRRFERKAWDRLIDYLIKSPPPSDEPPF
jgi:hypothetical protein